MPAMRIGGGRVVMRTVAASGLAAALFVGGCVDPLARDDEQGLREELLASYRQRIASLADSQPVQLATLLLVPQGQFQKHLHTLATIAKQLHKKELRQALLDAPDDPKSLIELLKSGGGK